MKLLSVSALTVVAVWVWVSIMVGPWHGANSGRQWLTAICQLFAISAVRPSAIFASRQRLFGAWFLFFAGLQWRHEAAHHRRQAVSRRSGVASPGGAGHCRLRGPRGQGLQPAKRLPRPLRRQ